MVDMWHFLGSNIEFYTSSGMLQHQIYQWTTPLNLSTNPTIFCLTFIKHIVEKAKESRPTGIYYCTIIADNTSGVFPTPRLSNLGLDA